MGSLTSTSPPKKNVDFEQTRKTITLQTFSCFLWDGGDPSFSLKKTHEIPHCKGSMANDRHSQWFSPMTCVGVSDRNPSINRSRSDPANPRCGIFHIFFWLTTPQKNGTFPKSRAGVREIIPFLIGKIPWNILPTPFWGCLACVFPPIFVEKVPYVFVASPPLVKTTFVRGLVFGMLQHGFRQLLEWWLHSWTLLPMATPNTSTRQWLNRSCCFFVGGEKKPGWVRVCLGWSNLMM